ncbi:AAA family ATPase [Neisseria sp. S1]|uniref:AAA family ATPase n=1 Tax=Neisseria sp. S1 TaxID=3318354 RepID=UPI003A86D3B5
MLQSITLKNTATYQLTTIEDLAQVNFFYGANGSGKTTISKVISDVTQFPNCSLVWKNGNPLQTMVYNQDFIDRNFNFNQSAELKGIFTLGENQVDAEKKISEAKQKCQEIQGNIDSDKKSKVKKESEKNELEEEFKNTIWKLKTKYGDCFKEIFTGLMNSKEKLKNKVLHEYEQHKSNNDVPKLDYLKKQYFTLFQSDLKKEDELYPINAQILIDCANNYILKKKIIGSSDVNISELINKLDNSDWIRKGIDFLELSNGFCPFCQQKIQENLKNQFEIYFDENFLRDTQVINDLKVRYEIEIKNLNNTLERLIQSESSFLEIEKLKLEQARLSEKLSKNVLLINEKINEPGRIIELNHIADIVDRINAFIAESNQKIKSYNKIVTNSESEKKQLNSQIWLFIIQEVKIVIEDYHKKNSGLDVGILNLSKKISEKENEKSKKEKEIKDLATQLISIQPTVDEINSMLRNFGFNGFSLKISDNQKGYQLIRSNGEIAKNLSEGEKTFITFLYFYHLLKGDTDGNGITADRIVVLDDPISSLDSDILFIVSTLIRDLLIQAENGSGYIKQFFVLTHNVYFYKEITFKKNIPAHKRQRAYQPWKKKFWIVRKSNMISNIEAYSENPINTSYELLWSEVRKQDLSNHNLPNTLRRILENYFHMWGGIALDELPQKFSNVQEQRLCEMLLYWANAGSHILDDGQYFSMDDDTIQKFLDVFKKIFEETQQLAHYNMMMKLNEQT